MKTAVTIRGAGKAGQTLVCIGAAALGLIAAYLVAEAPPYYTVLDEAVRRTDEALCAELGFSAGTQDSSYCIITLRGARNDALAMSASFP